MILVAAAALGIFATKPAAAQDEGADPPPAEPTPPAEPAPPPPEPAPPPPEAAPPPPEPAPPPKDPVITLEETPEEPPRRPAPTPKITLEETPEEPAAKPRRPRARKPKKQPEPAPVTAPQQPSPPPPPAEPSPVAQSEGQPEPKAKEGEDKKEKEDEDDGEGLFGPFRIGGLVGAGLPGLLSFGGMIKITRYVGAGLNIGLIPSIRLSYYGEAQLSYQEYDIYGRLFPFGGMVFLGAGVGYASISGSLRSSFDISAVQRMLPPGSPQLPNPLFVASEGSVKTLVLTPTIGLLHTFGSGFTVGLDAGVQMPIAPSRTKFETRVPPSTPPMIVERYIVPNDRKVRETLDTAGGTIIPTLNFRIGWLL